MKRVAPEVREVMMPKAITATVKARSLWDNVVLADDGLASFNSACLGCPDERCMRFADAELGRKAQIESPFAPDPSVCPTNAMNRTDDGTMSIREHDCIGCGLCAVRCPVGAIHLDSQTAVARVERPDPSYYKRRVIAPTEFNSQRAAIAEVAGTEAAPFSDADRVKTQIHRATPIVEGAAGQRALRLLTRNAFLLGGVAARLKNFGDNAAPAELLVESGSDLLVVEIESGSDVQDAVRRAVSGSAVAISRLGANRSATNAMVVMPKLPNQRVEFYRVVSEIRERLGLSVYGVPLALLLLGVRAGGKIVSHSLRQFCEHNGMVHLVEIEKHFGTIESPATVGLTPAK